MRESKKENSSEALQATSSCRSIVTHNCYSLAPDVPLEMWK